MIEMYQHKGIGYNPFFIKDDWQVAQLNYMQNQGISEIRKLDMHLRTDEIFILLKGSAVLIAASEENENLRIVCMKMLPEITYNIPSNTWHNIALDKDASVIIVEKSNTHLSDFIYRQLTENEIQILTNQIISALK